MRKFPFLLFSFLFCLKGWGAPSTFVLSLQQQPQSIDPFHLKSNAHLSLHNNLFRNLYRYNSSNELTPDLAEKCTALKNKVTCTLKKNLFWSDNTPITATDFLKTYERILQPNSKSLFIDELFTIENAKKYYVSEIKDFSAVGVKAINPTTLEFTLTNPPQHFLHSLTQISLAPFKQNAFSGPYILKNEINQNPLQLIPNPFYWQKNLKRPIVEFLILTNDSTALHLYSKNKLHIVRRLPASLIPQFKNSNDFHWVKLARMDFFGFSPELLQNKDFRQKISKSLNYTQLQKIYASPQPPGCPGIPSTWLESTKLCFQKEKTDTTLPQQKIPFYFSKKGGQDHDRTAEWLYYQFKDIHLELLAQPLEQNKLIEQSQKPGLFMYRLGITPETLTCYSILKQLPHLNKTFDELLYFLKQSPLTEEKKNCQKAVNYLMTEILFIPTGEISYAHIISPAWNGIEFNELNQIDLSLLQPR